MPRAPPPILDPPKRAFPRSTNGETVAEEAGGDEGVAAETAEQREGVEQRIAAWEAARKAGKDGQKDKRTYLKAAAPAGTSAWVGEVPIDPVADDWEPAHRRRSVGAVGLLLTTRYGTDKPCPATARRRSSR